MTVRKKSTSDGVIIFHCSSPLSFMKSEEPRGILKHTAPLGHDSRRTPSLHSARTRSSSGGASGTGPGRKAGDEAWVSRPPRGPWVERLTHGSQGKLQARLDVEHQETNATIQPVLDSEDSFMKELDRFLCQRDAAELRKKELQHKRWTERVWMPLQRRVEENVSAHFCEMNESLQHMSRQYTDHCNAKGCVFLDSYNPQEYNPFLLKINKPHYFTIRTPALRDPLLFQSRKRIKENRAILWCQTGRQFTRRQVEEVLQNHLPHPLRDSVISQTELPLLVPPRKPNRSNVTPYQVTATATPDGRCYRQQTADTVFSSLPHSKYAPSD